MGGFLVEEGGRGIPSPFQAGRPGPRSPPLILHAQLSGSSRQGGVLPSGPGPQLPLPGGQLKRLFPQRMTVCSQDAPSPHTQIRIPRRAGSPYRCTSPREDAAQGCGGKQLSSLLFGVT